jgi:hypothetical protein
MADILGQSSNTDPNTNANGGRRFHYPFENEDDYKARVIFSLVETKSTGELAGGALQKQIESTQNEIKELQKQYKEIQAEAANEDQSETQFKEQLAAIRNQIRTLQGNLDEFKGLQSASTQSSTVDISNDSIELYLPAGLAFRDNVTYENFDLGATGAMMEGGMGFAESMTKGVGSFVSGLTGGSGADVAKLAGIQLASKFGTFAAEAQAVQKLAGGVTLNPNSRVLFKQPNIREFAFAFKFVARSQREANEVKNIIKFLRTELYPANISVTIGDQEQSLGYRFPNKFRIEFEYDGEPLPGLMKIQDCYLRDVSTTYNASAMSMHSDGHFLEVDMTLNFQETRALTREKIEEGF